MSNQLFILFVLHSSILICTPSGGGGGTGPGGKWPYPSSGVPCIVVNSQIDLHLTYYDTHEAEKDGQLITVPPASTVNQALSSCNLTTSAGGKTIETQVIRIDFDHRPGWWISLAFSKDKMFELNGNQWALYQVTVSANYSAYPNEFPGAKNEIQLYTTPVKPNDLSDMVETLYAPVKNYYYCPSKEMFAINKDTKIGPLGYIQFSSLTMEAYKSVAGFKSTQKTTCAVDQHETDKVPLIVGGCLAGLTILTLVVYLIYRWHLPPEVLHMVNPDSSYENKAMTSSDEHSEVRTESTHSH